jgi:hypothetical protein
MFTDIHPSCHATLNGLISTHIITLMSTRPGANLGHDFGLIHLCPGSSRMMTILLFFVNLAEIFVISLGPAHTGMPEPNIIVHTY